MFSKRRFQLKKLKKTLFITLFILCTQLVAQQTIVRITGLPDSSEIPGAQVRITHAASNFSYQSVTNFNGQVQFSVSIHDSIALLIEVQSLGYTQYNQLHWVDARQRQLTIALSPEQRLLNQVLVTASYKGQNQRESVYASKIITEEKIEAMGAVSLNDVLSNELNIRLEQDNVLGTGVKLQGTGGQNVKILVDGVPMIGRLDGNIDLSQINLNNVERIEIIEGPLSVNYGSDALAGTINIITKKNLQGSWQIAGQNYYESIGQYNADLKIGKRFKNHMLEVHGGRYFFDGWSPNDNFWAFPLATPADTSRTHQWKPKEQYFGGFNYRYIRNNWNLRLNYEGYYEKMINRGMPLQPYFQRAFDDEYHTTRHTGSLHFETKIGMLWNAKILASGAHYVRFKNTYVTDLNTLERELSSNMQMHDTTGYNQYMSRGNFYFNSKSGKINTEIGYEVSHEAMEGVRIESGRKTMDYADLFVTAEWKPVKHILVKPGVRYGYNSMYATRPIPSIHLKYDLKNWIFRASIAQGFRAPSVKELYFDFVDINHNIQGNPNLSAETSTNLQFNISKDYSLKKNKFGFELKTFYNDIRDQINLQVVEGTMEYRYFNLSKSQTTGANIAVEYAFSGLQISAGFAYLAYKIESPEYSYPDFLNYPEARTSLLYDWTKTGLKFGVFYKFSGVQPNYMLDANGNPILGETDAFHMMDISISRQLWAKRLNLTLGVKNLFDVQQVNRTGTGGGAHSGGGANNVARGRSVFLSLKYNFVFNDK